MRKTKFTTGYYYHIYNRGTDKRLVFIDIGDMIRFIKALNKYRQNLVDIICYCLMPNHYHLLLRQLKENGISRFMHSLGTCYTKFFNAKHHRNGVLFQGKFKDVEIKNEGQFINLSAYIHANPVKDRDDLSIDDKIEFLDNYLWSSYQDYVGLRNGILMNKNDLINCIKENSLIQNYKELIKDYLINYVAKNKNINDLMLE